jgi:hypothetical protein
VYGWQDKHNLYQEAKRDGTAPESKTKKRRPVTLVDRLHNRKLQDLNLRGMLTKMNK